jgi:hypothetical protein
MELPVDEIKQLQNEYLRSHPEHGKYEWFIFGKHLTREVNVLEQLQVIPPVKAKKFINWIDSPYSLMPLAYPEVFLSDYIFTSENSLSEEVSMTLASCKNFDPRNQSGMIVLPVDISTLGHPRNKLDEWNRTVAKLEKFRRTVFEAFPCFTIKNVNGGPGWCIKIIWTDSCGNEQVRTFEFLNIGGYLLDLFGGSYKLRSYYWHFTEQLNLTYLKYSGSTPTLIRVDVSKGILPTPIPDPDDILTTYFELLQQNHGDFVLVSNRGVEVRFISLTLIARCEFFAVMFQQRHISESVANRRYQTDFSTRTLRIFQRCLYKQEYNSLIKAKLIGELLSLMWSYMFIDRSLQHTVASYLLKHIYCIDNVKEFIETTLKQSLPEDFNFLKDDLQRILDFKNILEQYSSEKSN